MNYSFQAAHKDITFGITDMLLQHPAGQEGDDRKRNQHGCQDGKHYCQRQATYKITGAFRHKSDRQEGNNQHSRTANHRKAYLPCRLQGGFQPRVPIQHPALYVFYHYDAIVDKQTQRHYQSYNAELIEVIAKKIQQDDTDGQRQGDRDHYDDSGPRPQGQKRYSHQEYSDQEIFAQTAQPAVYIVCLVEVCHKINALRQAGLEFRKHRLIFVLGTADICPVFQCSRYKYTAMRIQAGAVLLVFVTIINFGDILQENIFPVYGKHDGLFDLFQGFVIAARLDVESFVSGIDATTGNIGDLALQVTNHRGNWYIHLAHFVEVQLYTHLAVRQTMDLYILQLRYFFQVLLQVFCILL